MSQDERGSHCQWSEDGRRRVRRFSERRIRRGNGQARDQGSDHPGRPAAGHLGRHQELPPQALCGPRDDGDQQEVLRLRQGPEARLFRRGHHGQRPQCRPGPEPPQAVGHLCRSSRGNQRLHGPEGLRLRHEGHRPGRPVDHDGRAGDPRRRRHGEHEQRPLRPGRCPLGFPDEHALRQDHGPDGP